MGIALMQPFNVIALLHHNVLQSNVYNENKGLHAQNWQNKGDSASFDFKIQCDVDDNGDGISGNGDYTCTAMRRTPSSAPVCWLSLEVRSQK